MDDLNLDKTLGRKEKRKIRRRKERYQDELEAQGYEVHVARGSEDRFMAVVVIDPEKERKGFLGPDGSVQWLDDIQGAGIGALGPFVVSSIQDEVDDELGLS